MMTRVLLAAILAGLAAGLIMSAVQQFRVAPLIIAAEAFEEKGASDKTEATVHKHADGSSQDHGADWAPKDGFERTAFTVIFNVLTGVAFAFIMAAVAMLTGLPLTAGNGAFWGMCGFIAFMLAPSAGLPPELPGMPAGDLFARQIWWWATVIATLGGICVFVLVKTPVLKLAGAALIAAPHLIGAPQAHDHSSAVPAALANMFAANAIAVSALFWIVLGAALGALLTRQTSEEAQTA